MPLRQPLKRRGATALWKVTSADSRPSSVRCMVVQGLNCFVRGFFHSNRLPACTKSEEEPQTSRIVRFD